MRQNSRGFNSYFIFIILLLMGVALLTSMNGSEEAYTKEQFIADMEADRVSEVVVRPNSEVPTGYLAVELRSGAERKLYVTDIGEAEALVRDHGFDPVVKDVPREGWVLTTLVPMLIVLAVGIFLPLTGPLCNLVWLFAGASMQSLFANYRREVDIAMALSLALCAISLVWPH